MSLRMPKGTRRVGREDGIGGRGFARQRGEDPLPSDVRKPRLAISHEIDEDGEPCVVVEDPPAWHSPDPSSAPRNRRPRLPMPSDQS